MKNIDETPDSDTEEQTTVVKGKYKKKDTFTPPAEPREVREVQLFIND